MADRGLKSFVCQIENVFSSSPRVRLREYLDRHPLPDFRSSGVIDEDVYLFHRDKRVIRDEYLRTFLQVYNMAVMIEEQIPQNNRSGFFRISGSYESSSKLDDAFSKLFDIVRISKPDLLTEQTTHWMERFAGWMETNLK